MKKIQLVYAPSEKLANEALPSHTYDYADGQPLPEPGDAVSFVDWTKPFKVVSRTFHYVNNNELQVFFTYDS